MKKRIVLLFLAFAMALSCMTAPIAAATDTSEAVSSAAEELPDGDSSAPPEEPEIDLPDTPDSSVTEDEEPVEPEVPDSSAPASSPEEPTGDSSEEIPAEAPIEEPTEIPAEAPAEEEAPEEETSIPEEEAEEILDEAADTDPIHVSIEDCANAKLVDDTKYSKTKTINSATFSKYQNTTGLATGASISYNRLVTIQVKGLTKSSATNGTSKDVSYQNSQVMTNVMQLVKKYSHNSDYSKVLFKVVVPKGKYYLNYCMYLYSNTWLSMEGVTFYKQNTENKSMVRSGSASDSVSGYNGESNIILEGGTWNCRMSAYSYSSSAHFGVIRFGHNKNVLLTGVTVNGAVNGHHVEICGTKGLTITGCTMKGYLNTDYNGDTDYKEAIQLDIVNNSSTCPTYAKFDDTTTQNVVIYSNTFQKCCRGIGSHSAIYGKVYTGIVVDSNTFTNLSGAACHMLEYQNTAITNNTMTKVGGGVELLAMCKSPDGHFYKPASGSAPAYSKVKTFKSNTVISGNTIKVNTSVSRTLVCGILVGGEVHKDSSKTEYCTSKYGGKTFTITGVTIQNNTITAAKDAGILLKYANSCTVTGNKISSVVKGSSGSGYGIQLSHCGTGIKVNKNTISGTKGHGIYVKNCTGTAKSYVTVVNNKVTTTGSSNAGVYFYQSKYCKLTKATVSSKSYAVQINGCSHITVGTAKKPNTLASKASYGVYANGSSKTGIKLCYSKVSAKTAACKAASGSKITTKKVTFTRKA